MSANTAAAGELLARRIRVPFPHYRLGLMQYPETGIVDAQREFQVICQFRRYGSVQTPAHAEYGAIACQDGAKPALQPVENGLETEERARSTSNGLLAPGKRPRSARHTSDTRVR